MHTDLDSVTEYRGQQDLELAREIEDARVSAVKERGWPLKTVSFKPYLPAAELVEAVNLAIALGRPLLLQGDPGCGKTMLAHAVAYELSLPLEECYIKSTSRAQDLLYTYDAINRLYHAQLGSAGPKNDDGNPLSEDIRNYIKFGQLGRAIIRSGYGRRSIVLIDEIDKADLDFPNDLLFELEQLAFQVAEVEAMRYSVPVGRPDLRPIVLITHNEEKALPSAFLRRCIYHYVKMPKEEARLLEILSVHGFSDLPMGRKAVEVLTRLRKAELVKRPGLSELLDWIGYASYKQLSVEELGQLPFLGTLVKQLPDQDRARRAFNLGAPGVK